MGRIKLAGAHGFPPMLPLAGPLPSLLDNLSLGGFAADQRGKPTAKAKVIPIVRAGDAGLRDGQHEVAPQ